MVLFDFNDVFVKFSEAVNAKFGKLPQDMTKTEYDAAMSSLVRTTFYKDLEQQPLGFDLLKWALTFRDKEVSLVLVNEVKSPIWVNKEKIDYMDAACIAMGLPTLYFYTCTPEELKGYSWLGPLVTRNYERRRVWDSQPGGYRSAYMEDDITMTIWNINQSYAQHK